MTIEFKPLSVENLGGLQILVYGDTGVGKTTFAASAYRHPQLRRVGILDTDGGLTSISHWSDPGLVFASVDGTANIEEVAMGAIGNKPPFNEFNTWVVDSLSRWVTDDMREISEREFVRNPGKRGNSIDTVQIQDYKEMTARISRLSTGLKASRRNVIFTAALADIGATPDNPNFSERRPHMPNAIWKSISHMMDCIWWVYRRPNGGIYALTRSVVLPTGGIVVAKTRNDRFATALLERSERDEQGKPTGVIQIGHQDEPNTDKFLDMAKIYQIYLDSVSN